MLKTLDMQDIRYLNLFGKITGISTRFCFNYNEIVFFCVPKRFISKAVGENGKNIKKISEIIGKKLRVLLIPRGIYDAKEFIERIVTPLTFRDLNVKDNEIILTAGPQSKALLIGRNKRRFFEMQKISRDYFGKEFRIV